MKIWGPFRNALTKLIKKNHILEKHFHCQTKEDVFAEYFLKFMFLSSVTGLDIRGPNWVSVLSNWVSILSNQVLIFWIYQNQLHSNYMKVWFGTGSGSISFGSGLVNLQRTGTIRCIFTLGSQSVLRIKYTWFVSTL